MTGNSKHKTYKNAELGMVKMACVYPHYSKYVFCKSKDAKEVEQFSD